MKRSPELAVRFGLGASRARIRQQLLVEGLLLSSIGGAVGIFLASMSVGLVRQIPGLALPRLEGLHLNLIALFASVAIARLGVRTSMRGIVVACALLPTVIETNLEKTVRP